MKKLLLIAFISVIAKSAFTQTPITLEYSNMQPEVIFENIKYKQPVKVIIKNINRKIYKVETSNTKSDFNLDIPEVLKSFKLPAFLNLSLPLIINPRPSGFTELAREASSTVTPSNFNTKIGALLKEIERVGKKMNNAILLYNTLQAMFKDCSLTSTAIQTNSIKRTFEYLELPGTSASYTSAEIFNRLKDSLNSFRKKAEDDLTELQKLIPAYIILIEANQEEGIERIVSNKERTQALIDDEKTPSSVRKKAKGAILDYSVKYRNAVSEQETFKNKSDALNKQFEDAKEVVNAMYEFEKDDKINNILTLYQTIANNRNFQFESETFLAKNDEIRYKVIITAQDLLSCDEIDRKISEIVIRTKGGLKMDFSSGIFLLGGNRKFLGESFYWENIDATTRKIISAESGKRLQLGVGALLHFYERSYKTVKLAGSIGASTTANFDDLNLHIGPSIIFGNKNRFIFTGGLALKSTKVLGQQLSTDISYLKDNSPDEIPTISKFPLAGWFLGLTYNLSKLKGE